MDDKQDTDAFLAAHYPNLDRSWLKSWLYDLNEAIGWLKQRFSGNGHMHVPWSGGEPQEIEWSVKTRARKHIERKSKRT